MLTAQVDSLKLILNTGNIAGQATAKSCTAAQLCRNRRLLLLLLLLLLTVAEPTACLSVEDQSSGCSTALE